MAAEAGSFDAHDARSKALEQGTLLKGAKK
jgi:hypothetical protein